MFVFFHQLSLPLMFLVILAMSIAVCWLLIGFSRLLVPRLGYSLSEALPIRDSVIAACGGLFALIVIFSAAGIWNDAVAARNAVQHEANAVENAMILSVSLPPEQAAAIRGNLHAYLRDVLDVDWPAMRKSMPLDDKVFDRAETHLFASIALLSRLQAADAGSAAIYTPLLNQLLDVQSARLARIATSNAGISWVQWIAMWLMSTTTLFAIVLCNCHDFRMQVIASHLYVVVAAAAYFVILAHDRPFIGQVSIQPAALQSLLMRY